MQKNHEKSANIWKNHEKYGKSFKKIEKIENYESYIFGIKEKSSFSVRRSKNKKTKKHKKIRIFSGTRTGPNRNQTELDRTGTEPGVPEPGDP